MSRSVWKGPFVELSLMKKVQKHKDQNIKKPIKTWSRKSTIIPEFIGMTFEVHNGKKFFPVTITDEMIGHKLGEFSATRQFEIKKTLKSAIANAENNNQLDIDNLIVKEAYVGKGITLKRFMPRARGRSAGIKKHFSNLTIIVSESKKAPVEASK